MSKSFWGKVGVFCVATAGAISSLVTIGEFVSGNVDFGNWSVDARIMRWVLLWITGALGLIAAFLAGLSIKGMVQFLRQRKLAKENADRQQAERQERAKSEKAKKQRKYILERFDWLLQWHSENGSIFEHHKIQANIAAELAQAMEFTVDLIRLGLMNPEINNVPRGHRDQIDHLAAVRKKYELRGLEDARRLVQLWRIPEKRKSNIDTSVE